MTLLYKQPPFICNPWAKISETIYKQQVGDNWAWEFNGDDEMMMRENVGAGAFMIILVHTYAFDLRFRFYGGTLDISGSTISQCQFQKNRVDDT